MASGRSITPGMKKSNGCCGKNVTASIKLGSYKFHFGGDDAAFFYVGNDRSFQFARGKFIPSGRVANSSFSMP